MQTIIKKYSIKIILFTNDKFCYYSFNVFLVIFITSVPSLFSVKHFEWPFVYLLGEIQTNFPCLTWGIFFKYVTLDPPLRDSSINYNYEKFFSGKMYAFYTNPYLYCCLKVKG